MKKVTVDLMLGRKSKSHFQRKNLKLNIVAAQMPVKQAVKTGNYALRFGKNGLNAGEICDKFNEISSNSWKAGIIIPTVFIVSPTKTFVMEIKSPTGYILLDHVLDFVNEESKILDLPNIKETWLKIIYKMGIIKQESIKQNVIESSIKELCGTIKSMDLGNILRKEKKSFNYKKKGKK